MWKVSNLNFTMFTFKFKTQPNPELSEVSISTFQEFSNNYSTTHLSYNC